MEAKSNPRKSSSLFNEELFELVVQSLGAENLNGWRLDEEASAREDAFIFSNKKMKGVLLHATPFYAYGDKGGTESKPDFEVVALLGPSMVAFPINDDRVNGAKINKVKLSGDKGRDAVKIYDMVANAIMNVTEAFS